MKNALTNYLFIILASITLIVGLISTPSSGMVFAQIFVILCLEVMIFFNWLAFSLVFRCNKSNGYYAFIPSLFVILIAVTLLNSGFLIYQTLVFGFERAANWSFQIVIMAILIFILLIIRSIANAQNDEFDGLLEAKCEVFEIVDELIAKSDALGIDRAYLRAVRDYLRYDLKFTEEIRDHETWKQFNEQLLKIRKSKAHTLHELDEVYQNLRRL
mgnify:CR=1 FL=1